MLLCSYSRQGEGEIRANLMSNIFSLLPEGMGGEIVEDIFKGPNVCIERIISRGHCSPDVGWYDQSENEWVIVLSGAGKILFDDGAEVLLKSGDYLNIPAHTRHRVSWTDPEEITVWLALFYN